MKDGHRLTATDLASRCLVVLEDPAERMAAVKLMRSLGFEVVEATGGNAGLDACLTRLPDIALVEWSGPCGVRFLKGLRALAGGDQVRVIFMSSVERLPDIHRAMAAGASDYLVRPIDRDLLAFKLAQTGLVAA